MNDMATEFLSATINAFEANRRLADRPVEHVPTTLIGIRQERGTKIRCFRDHYLVPGTFAALC